MVDAVLAGRTTEEWMTAFGGKVPFAPVLSIGAALENPYVASIGMIEPVPHEGAEGGELRTLASPFRVNGARPASSRAPRLGEHDEIMSEAG
jgi:crotonobetainyl-CoA:carnitine CoA-transferase CaiB-like acyl-CoA transferase